MNIQIPLKHDQFTVKTGNIAGEPCYLVTSGHVEPDWNDSNSIFRSSIWNKRGEAVSLGFKKFTNLGERPTFEPMPDGKLTFVEKLDGSLLIVSRYKGELIHRTRGTFDATGLTKNGNEIELLKKKYPKVFDNVILNTGCVSLLFEWTTPTNIIVVTHKEPELHLVGAIEHGSYTYWRQHELDEMARSIGVGRPKYYNFDSIDDAAAAVQDWEGIEGTIIYSENGQILKKVKSEWYKHKHYFMTGFRSIKRVIEMWETLGYPRTSKEFFDAVQAHHDFELAELLEEYINTIGADVEKILSTYEKAKELVPKQPEGRKQRAIWINEHDELFRSVAFLVLSGKKLTNDKIKKMLMNRLV